MLFEDIIYGPIHSRRLGLSLGVNLMPRHGKLCTFDCIYCECGFNGNQMAERLCTVEELSEALEGKLKQMSADGVKPDVITFSGNGEPTLHPDFEAIITETCRLRDMYCPSAKVSVLSNSTQLFRADVLRALMMADNRILKLDSAVTGTMRLIDQPVNTELTAGRLIELLGQLNGDFTLQTCFLRGDVFSANPARKGEYILGHVDNTTIAELSAWYDAVEKLHPKEIMMYVIDRKTPVETLEKISAEEMQTIAAPLIEKGFNVQVTA